MSGFVMSQNAQPTTTHSTLFSVLSVVIGVMLGLLALEGALRLASRLNTEIPLPPRQPGEIRIVTLGESTTAPYNEGSNDVSWPGLLSTVLNQRIKDLNLPIEVKVFNLGMAASSSPYLLADLKANLDRLDPDIVIAMMGVNDRYSIKLNDQLSFRNSHLFKLFFWTVHFGSCGTCFNYTHELSQPEPSFIGEDSVASNVMIRLQKLNIRTDEELDISRKEFEKWALPHPEKAALLEYTYLSRLLQTTVGYGRRGGADGITPTKIEQAVKNAMQASRRYVLKSSEAYVGYCNLLVMNGGSCLPDLLAAIKAGLQPRAPLLTVAVQHGAAQSEEFGPVLEGLGFDVDTSRNLRAATADSFRELANLARKHPFQLFVMQYPTGTIDGVRSYYMKIPDDFFPNFQSAFYWINNGRFDEDPQYSVSYISNENFDLAVKEAGARTYFRDLFGMAAGLRFGHATEKGNRLIAENASRSLIPTLTAISAKKAGH